MPLGRKSKEGPLETLAKKARGKNTCNSCMKTKTVYPRTIDGVTYMLCDGCKGNFD